MLLNTHDKRPGPGPARGCPVLYLHPVNFKIICPTVCTIPLWDLGPWEIADPSRHAFPESQNFNPSILVVPESGLLARSKLH